MEVATPTEDQKENKYTAVTEEKVETEVKTMTEQAEDKKKTEDKAETKECAPATRSCATIR